MGGWGKVRAPTMARLAEAMETRPKVTGKAYAAIISRSRPAGGLGCEDKRAVAEWADACGMGGVPLKDFEAAVVSNAAIAEEMFGGDAANAKKGVRLLVESGVVDRARQGRRGRASVYVTYPTRADVEEGSYAPPPMPRIRGMHAYPLTRWKTLWKAKIRGTRYTNTGYATPK